jgi:hypothetical protein
MTSDRFCRTTSLRFASSSEHSCVDTYIRESEAKKMCSVVAGLRVWATGCKFESQFLQAESSSGLTTQSARMCDACELEGIHGGINASRDTCCVEMKLIKA